MPGPSHGKQPGMQAQSAGEGAVLPMETRARDALPPHAAGLKDRREDAEAIDSRDPQGATEALEASGQSDIRSQDSNEGRTAPAGIFARSLVSELEHRQEGQPPGEVVNGNVPKTADDFLRKLPEAVVVSSTTREGLDTLKEEVLTMLGFAEWDV
jgi:hypothetical protein